ncbi:MAG: type IIA DNA topoisomerase subunit B [Flavobacteriales bacterium]|nr:type IIA DNA topoisomerase subunit B [Flavobacteriales bacterium]MCX7650531.1 type IIA DNA topoisomerase subunit B [Flavobacteriales bacterium]MDW8431739.1 DNA topoisomerase IV subunit B [Flavobacteriales bacterium]
MLPQATPESGVVRYTEDNIRTLEWHEHIRLRPGMYIGKTGDGSAQDDGIYILLKEVIDNAVDEHVMGFGKDIRIEIQEGRVRVRDYGRGIPLGKLVDCVARINTGAKYDSEAFKKAVGLNGVGTKAVNALSLEFCITSFREGQAKTARFCRGKLIQETPPEPSAESSGTLVEFLPDDQIFPHFKFRKEYLERLLRFYAWLNPGLTLWLNGESFRSDHGLLDLLKAHLAEEDLLYPVVHLRGRDVEVAFTHTHRSGEEYYSFVNGQFTPQGGTHQAAFKEALVRTVNNFFKKDFEPSDVRSGIVAAIAVKVVEPVFESQTKTKLGSTHMSPEGATIRSYIGDFLKNELDNLLHRQKNVAEALQQKITENEKVRKEIAGIKKLARERAKRSAIHNKKLRDCKIHYNSQHERRFETTLFITEGDSASGSITKARDVATQAVFSLKGKPLNVFGLNKKVVYENEEFNLLISALNIEEGLEGLRYNNIVLATDADVDGMHIRLLLITFFLQFYPELVRAHHLYILQTPLFRVRNKKETRYCYTEEERLRALRQLGPNPEITRFKGLGEISPDEFRRFIGPDMRLEPVAPGTDSTIRQLLEFYMGKNTPARQEFIIENLRVDSLAAS